jgi:effector-binding domain-containing protein
MLEFPMHQDMLMVRPLLHRDDAALRLGEVIEKGSERQEIVHVAFGGGKEFTLTFLTKDDRTFLSRIRGPQILMDGRKGEMRFGLSEPKAFGDITMPSKFEMDTVVGGEVDSSMSETVTTVVWNPEVPDGTFAVPKLDIPLDEVTVKDVAGGLGLVVVHEGSYDSIGETFARAFALAGETEAMFMPRATCVYLNDPDEVSDPSELRTEVIVGLMPTGNPLTDAPEGAELRQLPALTVAAMTIRGPYGEKEGEAIGRIMAWIAEEGRTSGGPPRVVYLHDPETTVPEDQVCEVQVPLGE